MILQIDVRLSCESDAGQLGQPGVESECFPLALQIADAGDEITEAIGVHDRAANRRSSFDLEQRHGETDGMLDRFAYVFESHAAGEMRRDGSENIPTVESLAGGFEMIGRVRQFNGGEWVFVNVEKGEDAVIRADGGEGGPPDCDGSPQCSHAGVDDGEIDAVLGKVVDSSPQFKSGAMDVAGWDAVRKIDQARLRIDPGDYAFHDADICVLGSKIRQQNDCFRQSMLPCNHSNGVVLTGQSGHGAAWFNRW